MSAVALKADKKRTISRGLLLTHLEHHWNSSPATSAARTAAGLWTGAIILRAVQLCADRRYSALQMRRLLRIDALGFCRKILDLADATVRPNPIGISRGLWMAEPSYHWAD